MKSLIVKKFLSAMLVGAMALSMTACGNKSDSDSSSEKFIIGFDAAFPPYGYQDENGEYVGFDLDLAEEVCKRNE